MPFVGAVAAAIVLGSSIAWALTAEQEAKLLPSDGAADDLFGDSVALDGDTAIIGAVRDDHHGVDSGSAYVFTRMGSMWTERVKLLPTDVGNSDLFGGSVAIDGDVAIIGANRDDDNGLDAGAAYVLTGMGSVWTEQAKLLASDGAVQDVFGSAVAFDGDTAIVGSTHDDDNGWDSGSAYVFTRVGSVWTEQAKLVPADGASSDVFGWSVAIDGNTAVIGAYLDDVSGENSGSAYVFTRAGEVWTEQAKLLPGDGAATYHFGISVALDGDTAIIGARGDNNNGPGSAYIFTRTRSVWTQQAKLVPADGADSDQFGYSVAIDGDTAIIGAHWDDDHGENSGSAYVFTRAREAWTEQAKLLPTDGAADDGFGYSVALDGVTALVGAPYDDDNGNPSGSAYVFRIYDDDVPATGVASTLLVLTAVLGTGVYFLRRRATT